MKYEYLQIDDIDALCNKDLNALGSEGWELVSLAISPPDTDACLTFFYVFKRPRGEGK